jgi:hypothetical protein
MRRQDLLPFASTGIHNGEQIRVPYGTDARFALPDDGLVISGDLSFKEGIMSDTRVAKSNLINLNTEKEQQKARRITIDQSEERNVDQGLKAEEQKQEDVRNAAARSEQQDLNQGMDTGTHDSVRHGVNWGPAYQMGSAANRNLQKKQEPDKKAD